MGLGSSLNETSLLKLSLILSILGLIILYFLSQTIEVNDTTIEKISTGQVSGLVNVEGRISSISNNKNITIFTISSISESKVVSFDAVNISEGDFVVVTGNVDKNEIIAQRIVKK